ncbi:unnamed protein product [Urochloa decumbens]|uniref:PGG domain-containing protein n=1 Tax=Urochloa decumbens TaxID=240449 RepID=A0ABC9AWI3_9POAL
MAAATTTPISSGEATMDRRLLEAAISGDAESMKHLALYDPSILLGTTPQGNTCLHIACIQGHEEFCKNVLTLGQSLALLTAINEDGETPLLTAVTRGRASLASIVLRSCRDKRLIETILRQDKRACNALHHATRSGDRVLALELIETEPALSKALNIYDESSMFIAVMRNFTDVFNKLLEIPDSADSGACGFNALHAAVRNGNQVIAKRLQVARPRLARQETGKKQTPMHLAAYENKIDVLRVLLQHDPSLGYLISTTGVPLLCTAASRGHVGVARELLKHCPDAPYYDANGWTCLHESVSFGHMKFVEFILGSHQLRQLVNMQDRNGRVTALHLAVSKSKPEMVATLKLHQGIDVSVLNSAGIPASWELLDGANRTMPLISVADNTASDNSGGATRSFGRCEMDRRLLEASAFGHAAEMKHLALHVPGSLHGTTPQGNTCLHIASIHGHEEFCKNVMTLEQSDPLITAINADGETPLLTAAKSGHSSLASFLLSCCRDRQLRETILKQDKQGCNVLHHAIRSGHRELALQLVAAEPALSRAVNKYDESPMFAAVMRNYADVFEKLLEIPYSSHGASVGFNALHAAVRNGNSTIAKKIMKVRPWLAREENEGMLTPVLWAVLLDKVDVLRVMLEHDSSLGYLTSAAGISLLSTAASRGHVAVARELLNHCPDAPCCDIEDGTCLHKAAWFGHIEFVEFVLQSQKLRKLVNAQDMRGETALHVAVQKCNPKVVAALLKHQDIDVTVHTKLGSPPNWTLSGAEDSAKTLNWNEVSMLMLKADPQDATSILNLHKDAKDKVTNLSRKDIKSLTQTYTSNTSLVAILITTITFAAAFTLPGGYSTDAGSEGLPIMARKVAFQAFLISDTLAMCSSLVVAFICVIARWEDLEFLLYYRSSTKKLMWFAYMATITAFASGLYTVLAPRLLWLAIAICVVSVLLPVLTKLLGEWPVLKLRFRLGRTFKSELLNMI